MLLVGLLCSHLDPGARLTMMQVLQILGGEATVPHVPWRKPSMSFHSNLLLSLQEVVSDCDQSQVSSCSTSFKDFSWMWLIIFQSSISSFFISLICHLFLLSPEYRSACVTRNWVINCIKKPVAQCLMILLHGYSPFKTISPADLLRTANFSFIWWFQREMESLQNHRLSDMCATQYFFSTSLSISWMTWALRYGMLICFWTNHWSRVEMKAALIISMIHFATLFCCFVYYTCP